MKRFKNNNLFNIFHLFAPPCRHTLGGKWITNCVCCYVLNSTHRMLAHVKIHFILSMLNCSPKRCGKFFSRAHHTFFSRYIYFTYQKSIPREMIFAIVCWRWHENNGKSINARPCVCVCRVSDGRALGEIFVSLLESFSLIVIAAPTASSRADHRY